MDEDDNEPVQMQVDEEAYPLYNITDFDTHSELKPLEKPMKPKVVKVEGFAFINQGKIITKKHRGDEVKAMFFFQVYEKGLTAEKAAKLSNIPCRTAYNWYEKDQLEIQKRLRGNDSEKNENNNEEDLKKKPGRKAILNAEHKQYLEQQFGDDPTITLDQALESLTSQLEGLKVSQTIVHRLMTNECALSVKKAYFYPTEI
ncbi:hypothetical protein RMATCC62417_14091 [Rhizopus microsporus]|nr:hypothetical protein RMATCC62417_14091 [Rhizopus microsporus]